MAESEIVTTLEGYTIKINKFQFSYVVEYEMDNNNNYTSGIILKLIEKPKEKKVILLTELVLEFGRRSSVNIYICG